MDEKVKNAEEKYEVSISQAKTLLDVLLKTNKPVLIHSKPGIGKSTFVKDLAKEKGWEFVDIRPSQTAPEDIGGIPVPEKDTNGVYRMQKALPAVYPTDENSKGILFLDELTTCREDIQNALLGLCQERTLSGVTIGGKPWKLPSKWVIVAACNDEDGNDYTIPLSQPLNNRFAHIYLSSAPQVLKKDFISYAKSKEFDEDVIGFINKKTRYLYEDSTDSTIFATPRAWEAVSNMLKALKSDSKDDVTLFKNCIENPNVLTAFCRTLLSSKCTAEFVEYLLFTYNSTTKNSTLKKVAENIKNNKSMNLEKLLNYTAELAKDTNLNEINVKLLPALAETKVSRRDVLMTIDEIVAKNFKGNDIISTISKRKFATAVSSLNSLYKLGLKKEDLSNYIIAL